MDTAESKDEQAVPYLSRVALRHLKPFADETCFRFDRRANVLIGPTAWARVPLCALLLGKSSRDLWLIRINRKRTSIG